MQRVESASDSLSYRGAGGDGLAMPSGEEDPVSQTTRTASAITWWTLSSIVLCIGLLLHSGLDVRASTPRVSLCSAGLPVLMRWGSQQRSGGSQRHRLRHFMSVRLLSDAPIEQIVASFLLLDQIEGVRSVEVGTNASKEGKARDHTLAFLLTFSGQHQLSGFLQSPERAAFLLSIQPFVSEDFIFEFESGVV
ncbi:MAG: hypothetical protein SGPRY_007453 [Prymnesium sp.]